MARAVDCDCGETITGQDDEDVFRQTMAHARAKHPELNITEEQGRALLSQKVRDA